MKRVEQDPAPIEDLRRIGGVLDFSFYRDAQNDRGSLGWAILDHLANLKDLGPIYRPTINGEYISTLSVRQIDRETFLGDWYDPETRSLRFEGVGIFVNQIAGKWPPRCVVQIDAGGPRNPMQPSTDGQFAYAFSQLPHGLFAKQAEQNRVFREVVDLVVPEAESCEILDWSGPELGKLSDYFSAGLEWWGVFLFTIFRPQSTKLAVISGSTTD